MYSSTITKEDLFFAEMQAKVPDLEERELYIGPSRITSLPCTRPWFGPFGVGLIKITDLRRGENGKLECQLADENEVPYQNGTAWAPSDAMEFWKEWPA